MNDSGIVASTLDSSPDRRCNTVSYNISAFTAHNDEICDRCRHARDAGREFPLHSSTVRWGEGGGGVSVSVLRFSWI